MKATISGFYGFGNTGDEAIALAITRNLRNNGFDPILLSSDPKKSAELYDCQSIPRMRPLTIAKAIASSKVVLSGGGGLLQDKTSARNLSYYLGIIRMASMMGKKVVVFNQSIGPLSPKGEKKVAAALKDIKVYVRDRGSLELLHKIGVKGTLGGDPALLLEPSPGIKSDPNTVIIAPRGDISESLQPLRRVVKKLEEKGRTVKSLSFYPNEDDAATRSLGVEMVSTCDPQIALNTIAASGFVIGVRLHALILAAAARVPFIGLAYDPKVQGFCNDSRASSHPTKPDPDLLVEEAYSRKIPNWSAIEDMKFRAMQSFVGLDQ